MIETCPSVSERICYLQTFHILLIGPKWSFEKESAPEYHMKDIIAVMDDLNLEKIMLMGHSLGAFISLMFAAHHPDRVEKVVLVDGAGDLSQEQLDQVFVGIKPALDRL